MSRQRKISLSATQEELVLALQARYPSPEWCLLPQVRNATGYSRTVRTADAIAINTWPSRGMEIHGFECKSHRGDWLSELRQPDKSAEIQRFMDRWWIVAAENVVRRADDPFPFPPTWGLLVLGEKGLVVEVDAPKLTPQPVTKDFVAAVLRAAHGYICPDKPIKDAHEKGYREGYDASEERKKSGLGLAESELHRLQEQVNAFVTASGIGSLRWDGGRIGAAVNLIMRGDASGQLAKQRDALRAAAETLDDAIAEMAKSAT